MDVEVKHLKIGEISVPASCSCLLNIRDLFENAPLGQGVYFDVGHSGQLCLVFCEKAVCPRCSHTALKWEDFGDLARTNKGRYFKWNILLQRIENCSAARTGSGEVTPLHAGEKANWARKETSVRGTDEQHEEGKRKVQNQMLGEKKRRLMKGAALTMSHRELQQHS